MPRFVSEPLAAAAGTFDPGAIGRGAPPLPAAFLWHDESLPVVDVLRSWNSTKTDRGEAYRDRHWFEFRTSDGRTAIVYFDRHAKRGSPWWLYTIDEP